MDYTASSCCSEMTVVSDNDSAFSSEGPRDSECSCDSCLCDLSFSTLGSDMSAINPFGSFKHSGALPHSVFKDSNSFAMSPVSEKTRSYTDCENSIFHDSTHVYMNLLERSMMTEVKATKFWTSQAGWDITLLSSRPDCEGTEDQTMIERYPHHGLQLKILHVPVAHIFWPKLTPGYRLATMPSLVLLMVKQRLNNQAASP